MKVLRLWLIVGHLLINCHHDSLVALAFSIRILLASSLLGTSEDFFLRRPDDVYRHCSSFSELLDRILATTIPTVIRLQRAYLTPFGTRDGYKCRESKHHEFALSCLGLSRLWRAYC